MHLGEIYYIMNSERKNQERKINHKYSLAVILALNSGVAGSATTPDSSSDMTKQAKIENATAIH